MHPFVHHPRTSPNRSTAGKHQGALEITEKAAPLERQSLTVYPSKPSVTTAPTSRFPGPLG
jgi:hypothetical protein